MSATATYTFDDNLFSDLHKDAYGFRPSYSFFQYLNCASDDEKQALWDTLIQDLERTVAEDARAQQIAIARFEVAVAITIANGAGDRATAIKWLKEAEGDQYVADEEYFEYLQGIPYGYIAKSLV